MRTSRALMTFWGNWGHFEDQLRTWGLRTLVTFCEFSWLFEDFVDLLRTFWRPEDLRISKHWRFLWIFWWLLVDWGPEAFEDFKDFLGWGSLLDYILRTFEDVDKLLRTLRSPWIPFVDLWGLRGLWWHLRNFWGIWGHFEDQLRTFWGPSEDWIPFVDLITYWGIEDVDKFLEAFEYLLRTFEEFWGLFEGSFEDLRPEDLGDLLSFSWPFEDFVDLLRTFWRPEDLRISKHWRIFWTFWWHLVDHLRTVFRNFWGLFEDHLMNIWGTFDDYRILRTLITFWGIEVALNTFCGPLRTSRALMTFWGIWGHFEDQLRTWGLRTLGTFCAFSWLFEDFVDLLRTFWRPEDLRISKHWRTFQEHLMTSCGPFEDLRPLRNFSRTFQDHWGSLRTFDYLLRILRTLINFWGHWGRLEYLLWTSEDFEGFEDLLRNLRTFWGSVENLRSEDLGYLLCIFLTFWGLCGPFEDFLKTWGPEDLKTLKNFLDLLMTTCGPFEDCF